MIRVAVSVEGQTEEEFIRRILAPHLHPFGVALVPILLGRADSQTAGGGNVSVSRLVDELVKLKNSFDAVTTFVDFYGFKGKDQRSAGDVEKDIRSGVEKRIGWQGGDKVRPYVQRHEFESLLFSDVNAFSDLPGVPPQAVQALRDIRSAFATPEDINDSISTSPSRRIAGAVLQYRKTVHGPLIAGMTGLERIRQECPRFDDWLNHLEALQD